MKKKQVEEVLKNVPKLPITKKLYSLKKEGDIPYVSVSIVDGEITGVIVNIMGVSYHFHKTSNNGKKLDVIKSEWVNQEKKVVKNFKVPFDGWSFGVQENPFTNTLKD